MRLTLREKMDLVKVSRYAVFANALQILFAAGLFVYALVGQDFHLTGTAEKYLLGAVALVVVWGAAMDIRDAFNARKIARTTEMLEEAYGQLEQLNGTLRAQRHDFMNHLQVVFGLIDLGEQAAAQEYIEKVYGDIQKVGRSLRTAIPAVNALLAAKMADCEEEKIDARVVIHSAWQGMPVAGWEMCRILGNLIDNAVDALRRVKQAPVLRIELGENLHSYTFTVENNGPEIPEEIREKIFQTGFTTKSTGRGMGMSIVRQILEENGGSIQLFSGEHGTRFVGRIPKRPLAEGQGEGDAEK